MSHNNSKACPIAIFAYNRLEHFKNTIEALQQCHMAERSELYVFSDGPKHESDVETIEEIRRYTSTIGRFKKVSLHFSETNKGLANSIKDGVSKILEAHESIIVLEDDLLLSNNFLVFMNQALKEYESISKVLSISGYTMPIKVPEGYQFDNYFTRRASSWGWATWKDRWEKVDWETPGYNDFINDAKQKRRFNEMGSDMSRMLKKQMQGKLSSWAIIWCYHQFQYNLLSVFPIISMVSNDGFNNGATHTKGGANRFATRLDDSGNTFFNFNPKPHLSDHFIKQFAAKYSLKTRAYYKLRQWLNL